MKMCKQCKNDFTIREEDRAYYNRIRVPEPTLCSRCRFQRREMFRNERVLYSRVSTKSGKPIISIFSPESPFQVFSQDEWWADDWNPPEAAFDFSRPFFEQFRELQLKTPRLALLSKDSENSEYANHSTKNRNVYMGFSVIESENVHYGMMVHNARDIVDCTYLYDGCELCYECFYGFKLYQCGWCLECRDSLNCWFCFDCVGCSDCFMSSNLKNKRFVFRNEELGEAAYKAKMRELFPPSYEKTEELRREWVLMQDTAIHRYANLVNCEDCVGDYLINSKACFQAVQVTNGEDSAYLYHAPHARDCFDATNTRGELCYETISIIFSYDMRFTNYSYDDQFLEYCDHVFNSEHCFGCVGLKHRKYSILNKQYAAAEYEVLKAKIIAHMRDTGEYGEFFPAGCSPFAYNETIAQDIFPLTKKEATGQGFTWRDNLPGTFGKETMLSGTMPARASVASESIVNEIFACIDCKRNYKITKAELGFYVRLGVPLPRRCPDCRYRLRMHGHNPSDLFARRCACVVAVHAHHRLVRCPHRFITKFTEGEAPKLVYCEECYQAEVV